MNIGHGGKSVSFNGELVLGVHRVFNSLVWALNSGKNTLGGPIDTALYKIVSRPHNENKLTETFVCVLTDQIDSRDGSLTQSTEYFIDYIKKHVINTYIVDKMVYWVDLNPKKTGPAGLPHRISFKDDRSGSNVLSWKDPREIKPVWDIEGELVILTICAAEELRQNHQSVLPPPISQGVLDNFYLELEKSNIFFVKRKNW